MISAAATGKLDFSKADSNDVIWQLREEVILAAVERELLADYFKLRALELAAVQVPVEFDKEGSVQKQFDEWVHDCTETYQKCILPHLDLDKEKHYKTKAEKLKAELKARLGDMSEEEFKERNAVDLKNWEKMQKLSEQRLQQEAKKQSDLDKRLKDLHRRLVRSSLG